MITNAHQIDYTIHGHDLQYVEIELDPQEATVAEAGAMLYMEQYIRMDTIFGDGSAQSSGFLGSLLGAGKRLLAGEGLFMTVFSNQGQTKQKVAFSAPYPGKIMALDLATLGGKILCQKDSFICAAKGVAVGIGFQKRIMTGLFGGEGFILQKLEGDGLAFIHAGGTLFEKQLADGEQLRVDTGCLVAFQPSIDFSIKTVSGIKNAFLGGEGFFFAQLTGPGKVWLQSLPFSRVVGQILQRLPPSRNNR
ncbi:MAG: TIGR00266 family protein [Gammaproteobacteria bacterium]